MADGNALAAYHAAHHPQRAVAVLDRFDAASAYGFLSGLSDDLAADLLTAMAPDRGAACLMVPAVAEAAMHLGNMPRRAAAAILRRFPADRRREALAIVPRATRLQLDLILHQPGHRIGAWIDASPAVAESGQTVATVRRRLARADAATGMLCLVDDAQRLQGIVPLAVLLSADDALPVDRLARQPAGTLRANMTIETALADPAWEAQDSLPVVDREGKLVGVVRHAALRRAGQQQRQEQGEAPSGEYVSLANTVYVGLAEILATSIGKTDPGRAAGPTRNARHRDGGGS